MPDFRKIDDPSRQADLARQHDFWNGMPGHATYRLVCRACGRTFYARMPTARWCCYRCARDGADCRRRVRAKARRERWRPCHRCGKPFRERRADARFCSNACRQAAYRVTVTGSAESCGPRIRNGEPGGDVASPKGAVEGTEGGLPPITTVPFIPLDNSQRESKVLPAPLSNRPEEPKVSKVR
jgi:hypothetical protein